MASVPDFCPACGSFVHYDWTTNCGVCAAELSPAAPMAAPVLGAPDAFSPQPPRKKSPKMIAAVAVGGAVVLIGGAAAALSLSTPPSINSASSASSDSPTTTTTTASTTTSTTKAPNPLQVRLVDSVQTTQQASTCDMAMSISTTGGDLDVSATGTGVFDFTKQLGSETITVGAGSQGSLSIASVFSGTTLYEKLPPSLTDDPSKPWVEMDLSQLSSGDGVDFDSLSSGQSSDPTQGLSMLLAASDSVTTVGQEQLRGTQTTHYRASLDFKTAAANTTDPARKAALQQLAQLYTASSIPVDVWIDSADRVRKISYSIDASQIAGASSDGTQVGTMSFTLEFYNFGTTVKVTVPPASQVTDLTTAGTSTTEAKSSTVA